MVAVVSSTESRRGMRALAALLSLATLLHTQTTLVADDSSAGPRFVDLSLLISREYPCIWPTFPPFQINHYEQIGRLSPYNSDIVVIDGNTGTQLDVPPTPSLRPRPHCPMPAPFGRTLHRPDPSLAVWRRGVRHRLPRPARDRPPGQSPLVKKDRVIAWEQAAPAARPGRCGPVL